MKRRKKWYAKPINRVLIVSIILNVILFFAFTNAYYDKGELEKQLTTPASSETTQEDTSNSNNNSNEEPKQKIYGLNVYNKSIYYCI